MNPRLLLTAQPRQEEAANASPAPFQTFVTPKEPRLTLGVEEEFLLVDARTWQLVPVAADLQEAVADSGLQVHAEGTRYQIEVSTPKVDSLADLRTELARARRILAAAAREYGCRLLASASPILTPQQPLALNFDQPRRRTRQAKFGALSDNLIACGRHVHVGTLSLESAVAVSNRVRPWLPTLIALSAASPLWNGRDTGHASWRSVSWSSWPSAGMPPHFSSAASYRRAVGRLIDSGAALDEKMVYWDMRPSERWPTLELRAPDMSPSLDGAVLQAALTRALVAQALHAEDAGDRVPVASDPVLRLARWRAARDGLEGYGLDPFTGTETRTATLVRSLVKQLAPELEAAGDYDYVSRTLRALLKEGSSTARQREVFARRYCPTDVLHDLAEQTEAF